MSLKSRLFDFFYDYDEYNFYYSFKWRNFTFFVVIVILLCLISTILFIHFVPYEDVTNDTISFNDDNYTFVIGYDSLIPRVDDGVDIYITCDELGLKNKKMPFYTDGICSYTMDVPKNVSKFTVSIMSYEKGFPFASEHLIYNVVRK